MSSAGFIGLLIFALLSACALGFMLGLMSTHAWWKDKLQRAVSRSPDSSAFDTVGSFPRGCVWYVDGKTYLVHALHLTHLDA